MNDKKVCFFIAPIGLPDSNTRKRSDKVLRHIVSEAVVSLNYKPIRADQISVPGMIPKQIIQKIVESPLIIVDLSEHNPNVFYELAICHILKKPLIQIISKEDDIPFDISTSRTIKYDITDLDNVKESIDLIRGQIKSIETGKFLMENPISISIDLKDLLESENPEKGSINNIVNEKYEYKKKEENKFREKYGIEDFYIEAIPELTKIYPIDDLIFNMPILNEVDVDVYNLEKSLGEHSIFIDLKKILKDYEEEAKRDNIGCFNSYVTRYKNHEEQNGKLLFSLESLEYFDYLMSHLPSIIDCSFSENKNYRNFREYINAKPEKRKLLGRPFGINILIRTASGEFLLQKRSKFVNIYPNTVYPSASGTMQYYDAFLLSNFTKLGLEAKESKKAIICSELYEEIGMLPNELSDLVLIGSYEDIYRMYTPDLFFLGISDKTSDEISKIYKTARMKDWTETKDIEFLNEKDFFDLNLKKDFIKRYNMPCSEILKVYIRNKNMIIKYIKNKVPDAFK
jgi:hypothetical protein